MGTSSSYFSSKAIGCSLWLGALFITPRLRAEPPPDQFRLAWVRAAGTESCVAGTTLEDWVRARLGHDPFDARAERSIEGIVSRAGEGFSAEIRVRGASGELLGERSLHSERDCAELSEASALAIALTIDPEAAARAPQSTEPLRVVAEPVAPQPAVTPAPTESSPCAAPSSAQSEHAASAEVVNPQVETGVAARVLVASGLLPRPAAGVGIAASVGGARAVLELSANFFPERAAEDTRFAFGLSTLGVGGCWRGLRSRSVELGACSELQAGALHAVVSQVVPVDPGDQFFFAWLAGPRARALLPLGARVELGASVVVPFTRPAFQLRNTDSLLFQSDAVGALGLLALGWEASL